MAPEIIAGHDYKGTEVDMYSLGVILFAMRYACWPMKEARDSDPMFEFLANHDYKSFWYHHSRQTNTEASDELKDLIIGLL